jgi:hypothetical protein
MHQQLAATHHFTACTKGNTTCIKGSTMCILELYGMHTEGSHNSQTTTCLPNQPVFVQVPSISSGFFYLKSYNHTANTQLAMSLLVMCTVTPLLQARTAALAGLTQ